MSLSAIPQGPRTLMVAIALVALYVGYAQLTAPWLTVEQKQQKMMVSTHDKEASPALQQRAERYFQEDPWVKTANASFGDNSRFMYFQNHELFNEDRSIKVDPIAMLWQDDKSETPYTLTARSAQLDATTKFKLDSNEFGAISSGQLHGDVRITGPDGLRIEGRTFSISDNALKITTSQPVKFSWGPHSGIAQSGAEIDLLSSGPDNKRGLMAITDVQRIRLLGRVDCDLLFQDDAAGSEAVKLKISAANGFEFFMPTHEATFFGFADRELKKDNQIMIERPTISGGLDRLFCSKLTLQFQPAVVETEEPKKRSTKLQLASIQAEGSKVVFTSREQNVAALMSRLKYHIEERVMELAGSVVAATGRPKPVQIYQSTSMLTAAHVLVAHDKENQIHTIQCLGPGQLEPSDLPSAARRQENEVTFFAKWSESLVMRQLPEQKVTLKGSVVVSQSNAADTVATDTNAADINAADTGTTAPAGTGMSLSGDLIEMTGTAGGDPAEIVIGAGKASKKTGMDFSRIRPKVLTATGNVLVTHNRVTGHINENLTVTFIEQHSRPAAVDKTKPISQSSVLSGPGDDQGETKFCCDTAKANINLLQNAQQKQSAEWKDVWLIGKVQIEHTGLTEDDNFSAKGNALSAKSGFKTISDVSLFGDPAEARLAAHRVEGPRIDLQERDPSVNGPGSIRFVNDKSFKGKPLEKPSVVEIYWTDSMTYSNRTAHFIGNIRAVMTNELDHKVQLTCASMKVFFTSDLQMQADKKKKNSLQADTSDSDDGSIERIECESKVVVDIDQLKEVDIDQMTEKIVVSRNHAEFSDLKVNMITGEFYATGSGSSGIVESTNLNSQNTPRTTPRAVARANTAVATPTDKFVFVQAKFIGSIEGNYKLRFVQLKQHVRGVFGPVRQMGEKIVLDELNVNELPLNTGSMRCENLSFSQIDSSDSQGQPHFEMVAESNTNDGSGGTHAPCHLESSEISGDADEIKYDSSKQQFILRADKGRQATVSYRPGPGSDAQTLTGEQFEYYRERNKLVASEITGVQTAGDIRPAGR